MNLNRIAKTVAAVAVIGSLSACFHDDTDPESTPTDDVATSEAPAEDIETPAEESTDDALEGDPEADADTDAPADEEDTDAPADEETPAEEDLQ